MRITWIQVLGYMCLGVAIIVLTPGLTDWRRILGAGLLTAAIGLIAEDWLTKP